MSTTNYVWATAGGRPTPVTAEEAVGAAAARAKHMGLAAANAVAAVAAEAALSDDWEGYPPGHPVRVLRRAPGNTWGAVGAYRALVALAKEAQRAQRAQR